MPTVRKRPRLATTLAPDVAAAVRSRAEASGLPIGRVMDAALRIGLGLPAAAPLPGAETRERRP